MASPSGRRPPVKVADCPPVAVLIDYAWDRLAADERRGVEAHLQQGHCLQCQAWVDQACRLPPPSLATPHAAAATDTSLWQRQAFQDLEERLRALAEEQN
jgi:hypothetical protein